MGDEAMSFGPWSEGLAEAERHAQLRELRALVFVLCGPGHPLVGALRDAVSDPDAATTALGQMEELAPLPRRRLLSTRAALARVPGRSSRKPRR
jgi:hypothetical protein